MKAGFLKRTRDEQIGEALSDDQLEKKLRYLDADFEHRVRRPYLFAGWPISGGLIARCGHHAKAAVCPRYVSASPLDDLVKTRVL
jgi:hypothetical protein